jgi:galactofuranosylgalactofuranosylrhamnosyl-N-acetylglucosaminyl-diphospho-decaprenol beta-1,5/1,6-galactofuranosyltransferase
MTTQNHIPGHDQAPPVQGGPGTLHLAQDLLVAAPDVPGDLYLRLTPAPAAAPTALPLHLAAGVTLSTDTFFGSFYGAYWQSVAGPQSLTLAIDLTGPARLKVMEDQGHGVTCLLDQPVNGPTRLALPRVPLDPDTPSRIYVELEALADCRVTALDVLTDLAPRRRTRLSIGLCTFNQEAHLTRTLTRLTALADHLPALVRIHVVNQGAPFAAPALQALCRHPKLHLIQQRNLGGTGGFTRTLVEEMAAADPASHHLLMDDDIVLDERMIARALRFLDFAAEDVALGAGMFDALRPEVMYEAGAFLRPTNRIEPWCHNVNLADPGQLWHFNTRVPTDYNAWWFCILPLNRVRQIGLPTPVFIRGDDFDYGQRLAEAGCATITLPGLGVWHDPFYAKPTSWQDYYDLRNRLIFGASHPAKVHQLSRVHVIGLISTAVLTHNYPSARLRLRAVTDYLAGPDPLLSDPESLHQQIMALARPDAPERLGPDWALKPLSRPGRPKPDRMLPLIWHMVRALIRTGLLPLLKSDPILRDIDATPLRVAGTRYVLTNGLRSYHLRFTPSRPKLWPLLIETWRLARRYKAEVATADTTWRAALPALRQASWWQARFAAKP